ncbi:MULTISPECIES: helix-turn-helix domain-containing protein [unclassified Pseudofrankia]|uniref:helix-turn-helix domain-containing protein n=1 Tax=unclassified Pseudofrankia TaxID=2994372 RepID=UPI000AF528A6|nr:MULTISPECIES: helix-turn-helix domain-containing protein [unclassified Pseudofrankia]MDT3442987.1 helix-turn-helix domain-containing protein [Pseudofrankia sp. BMG5.37]
MMYREQRARMLAATMWLAAAPDRAGETTAQADATSAGRAEHRVLPDGCMDLIWSRAGPGDVGHVFVAGPDTAPAFALWRPGSLHLGMRFDSAVGPARIGVPASEVRDRRVPLVEIWGAAEATRLAERLAAAEAPAAAFEAEIARRGRRAGLADLLPPAALAGIRAGAPVAEVARAAALSERQFLRRCQLAVGYGPKTLARIVRFRRALALARAGSPFAGVAAAAGYADQAHLAREVRALGGAPLRELVMPAADSVGAS